jgi:hypothetical protein
VLLYFRQRGRVLAYAVLDRDYTRAALLANEDSWRAGYERRQLPARPKPSLPVPASYDDHVAGMMSLT